MTKDKRSSWIRGDALVGEGWLYLPQEVSNAAGVVVVGAGCAWMCGLPKNRWVWWYMVAPTPKKWFKAHWLGSFLLGVVFGGVFF